MPVHVLPCALDEVADIIAQALAGRMLLEIVQRFIENAHAISGMFRAESGQYGGKSDPNVWFVIDAQHVFVRSARHRAGHTVYLPSLDSVCQANYRVLQFGVCWRLLRNCSNQMR